MFQRILVANDGSEGGYLALQTAIGMAKKFKAELHMVIVEELPIYGTDVEIFAIVMNDLHEHCASVVEKSTQIAKAKNIKLETHLLSGFPVSTITEFTQDGFDLLVVGFMKHSAFYRWFIGSTTDELVDYVPCSILVVK